MVDKCSNSYHCWLTVIEHIVIYIERCVLRMCVHLSFPASTRSFPWPTESGEEEAGTATIVEIQHWPAAWDVAEQFRRSLLPGKGCREDAEEAVPQKELAIWLRVRSNGCVHMPMVVRFRTDLFNLTPLTHTTLALSSYCCSLLMYVNEWASELWEFNIYNCSDGTLSGCLDRNSKHIKTKSRNLSRLLE